MSDTAKLLEGDLAWREAELGSLKLLCVTSTRGTVRHSALLRALVTMLYAHYEGFCKYALDVYVDGLSRSGEQLNNLTDELAAFALRRRLRTLKSTMTHHEAWRFIAREVPDLLLRTAVFDKEFALSDNLWPNILRQACVDVCLPHGELDNQAHRIKTLVARRNDIAHGQRHPVAALADYQEYEDAAFAVMLHLACAIIDSLDQRAFIRAGGQSTLAL